MTMTYLTYWLLELDVFWGFHVYRYIRKVRWFLLWCWYGKHLEERRPHEAFVAFLDRELPPFCFVHLYRDRRGLRCHQHVILTLVPVKKYEQKGKKTIAWIGLKFAEILAEPGSPIPNGERGAFRMKIEFADPRAEKRLRVIAGRFESRFGMRAEFVGG